MWYNILISFLKKHEFILFNVDFNVFFNEKLIIVIYVDNIFLIEFNLKHIVVVKRTFNKRFKMINLNLFSFYLNISIKRDWSNRILFFNQKIYLKKIFKNYDIWKCKSIIIFMNNNILKVFDFSHLVIAEQRYVYQFIVDFLMYVILKTRFDFIYVVFVINRYVFNFINIHWKTIKRIFRYIQKTLNFRLIFNKILEFFIEYIDVNWKKNRDTHYFTFEYVFNAKNKIIN